MARMIDHLKRAQAGFQPLFSMEAALQQSTLEPTLRHLVKLRASQINACAFCIQMHVAASLEDGEAALRLHMLPAWRESGLYSARERAALEWTEALTLLPATGAPDEAWARVEACFDEDERAWLTLAIGAINLWNRVQVGLRVPHADGLPQAGADVA